MDGQEDIFDFWDNKPITTPKPKSSPSKRQDLLDKMRGSTSTQESSGSQSIVNPDS